MNGKNKIIFQMTDICKSFPGVKALDGVSFSVNEGSVHALMGENGAGKSTLMKCAFGIYKPDSGSIKIENEIVFFKDEKDCMEKGIAMIHQELHPIRSQNVMENIWAGRIPYKKKVGIRWVDEKKMYADTKLILEKLNINLNPRQSMQGLSAAHCQLIEIARAISYDAKIIIMDEPTSSLSDAEVENLFSIIEALVTEKVGIVYISHKLDEIFRISNEITVLRDGKLIGSWSSDELTSDSVISKMVGRDLVELFPKRESRIGETCLKVTDFTSANQRSFKNINFELKTGEVLGIGGLVGAQRTELVESIFGLRGIASGEIEINGKKVDIKEPEDAIKNGIALLTEERRSTGIVAMLDITDNMLLANQTLDKAQYRKLGVLIDEEKRSEQAKKYVDYFKIKTPTLSTQIQYLSGGNQQKVLLGRWMLTEPDILILDEPTRGIDVGAKYDIYVMINELVALGKSVIIISSEMPELIGMSDRIMVMCEGHKSGELLKEEVSEEKIMLLASTHKGEYENA